MTLQNVHGDPIFTKINKHKKQYEYLTKDIDTEVIIVGGGVTGSIIGYYFSKNYDVEPIFPAAISLAAFFVLTPLLTTTVNESTVKGIPLDRLGAKGMFVGIICAFLITRLYCWAMKKNWTIKMPDGVPPTVAKSFAALIPGCIAMGAALIAALLFELTPWENAHDFIFEIVQTPLTSLGSGLVATLLAIFAIQVLWFFGLHGQIIVNSVLDPIWNTLSIDNYNAYTAGEALPNLVTKQFIETFTVGIGGTGMTLAVLVAIFAFAKSEQLRGVAKLAAPAGVFNVNEPVIFGLPIVMNPIIVIPWIVAPMVAVTVAYFALKLGLVPYTTGVSVPWTVPVFFSGMLATNSLRGGILQLVCFAIVFFIWAPFVKAYDRDALKKEKENEAQSEEVVETV